MKIYSCGYCGTPCDETGRPLDQIPENYNLNEHEQVGCDSCRYEQENRYITVTREMAMDACDLSLEGQKIKW
jgi:hypothetical protein